MNTLQSIHLHQKFIYVTKTDTLAWMWKTKLNKFKKFKDIRRAPAAQRQMRKKISFGPTFFHLAQTFGAYFFRRINNADGVYFLIGGDRWWLSVIKWDQLSTLILLIGHGVYLINQECNYIIELADCQ